MSIRIYFQFQKTNKQEKKHNKNTKKVTKKTKVEKKYGLKKIKFAASRVKIFLVTRTSGNKSIFLSSFHYLNERGVM